MPGMSWNGIEQVLLRRRIGHRDERGVTPFERRRRGGVKPRRQAGTHLSHLLAEITRDVGHLREPATVVGEAAEGFARGVADVGPEGGVAELTGIS